MDRHVADITQFASDINAGKLGDGGLFYLKGGFGSNLGLRPANAAPNTFLGDDDHPGESDQQVAEADVAALVNLIARSKYWSQSAIVITWDDPGGYWDHVPPPQWLICPDGHPCGNGQRVPLLLISPYARNGVVHEYDDQASVIKFAEHLFDRTPLAQLPDEARYMPFGPRDGSDRNGDLTGGFDEARLRGDTPPIPATDADHRRRRRQGDPQPVVVRDARHPPRAAAARNVGRAAARLQPARARCADESAVALDRRDFLAAAGTGALVAATPSTGGPSTRTLTRATQGDNAKSIIASARKIVTPNGIERLETVRIGGIEQWVSVRGHDRNNPVLMFIHGGPGYVSIPMSWWFAQGWDEYFTVVQWDQRGAGKTYEINDPATVAPTMTLDRMVDDAIEMAEWARRELGKAKIVALGHSFGSYVGLMMAHRRPDLLHAYVGVGQLSNGPESERRGWTFAMESARARRQREGRRGAAGDRAVLRARAPADARQSLSPA